MKQLIQSYRNGELKWLDVPAPMPQAGHLIVRTVVSSVSVGTEKYMLELASKSLLGKALARPDLVKQVITKAQSDGILEAWRQALGRLDTPVSLGYSSVGRVMEVGPSVEGFAVGERVACAGSGYASHAELTSVPVNLCVKVPDNVDDESAAFVALGGIALEAVRMARVALGETVVVIGLGLLGQLAIQLLNAAGCHVIGMDIKGEKAELAQRHGAEEVASDYNRLSSICRQRNQYGADAVIIFAATDSNEPLEQAAALCRERGRIVATGLIGLDVPRKPFYDKELELSISRAWGPGLYDMAYTEKNLDYPIAYARWTAQRNMEEFLAQVGKRTVRLDQLITHRFPVERNGEAYQLILEAAEPYMGVLLTYGDAVDSSRKIDIIRGDTLNRQARAPEVAATTIRIGLIGAGQFANGTLLPTLKALKGVSLRGLATSRGISARHVADKFGFAYCTTNYREILNDPETDLVCVLTRHGLHAQLVCEALQAGRHVFVEKPLALNVEQLRDVARAYQIANSRWRMADGHHRPSAIRHQLFVGFNRRYSRFTRWLKDCFAVSAEPLAVHCTVNAGAVGSEHWAHDPAQGGGRVVGEVCHFIDLIQCLTNSVPIRVYAETLSANGYQSSDNVAITLKLANDAIGSILYAAGGDKRHPRERIEVFGDGAVGVIENFRATTFTRQGRTQTQRNWLDIDRGYAAELQALLCAIRHGEPSVGFAEYVSTTLTTFAIEESLRKGAPINVDLGEVFS